MGHLRPAVEQLDGAADHPGLALGQAALEEVFPAVEEDQRQLAAAVMGGDAIGQARCARRLVAVDGQGAGGDPAGLGPGDTGPLAAVDQEIGRAACRERVGQYVWTRVVAVSLKKTK